MLKLFRRHRWHGFYSSCTARRSFRDPALSKTVIMKKIVGFFAAVVLATTCWSFAEKGTASVYRVAMIEPDSAFIIDAASTSMMEIQLGKVAQEKGQNPRVKSYGTMMVRDHETANSELQPIAAKLGVKIPTTLLPKHARHVSHLQNLQGIAFDRAYINMMVESHKDALDEFEDASKKAADADLKAFAAKQLPVLQMHRDSAIAIRKR